MQVDNNLLKCGETATTDKIDRLALSPLPIANDREPLAINKFFSTTKEGVLKINLVSQDVHLTQLLLVNFSIMSTMIILFWLFVGENFLIMLPMAGLVTLCVFSMYYINFKDENEVLANNPPIMERELKNKCSKNKSINGMMNKISAEVLAEVESFELPLTRVFLSFNPTGKYKYIGC